jgi:glycosyltransferase involved in cell wall biosynthesis
MTGIHQVLADAAPGDAVTDHALGLQQVLRRVGHSEIYARRIRPELSGLVWNLSDYPRGQTHDLLIHHASIGEPYLHAFLLTRLEPLVLVYHGTPPPPSVDRWDPELAEQLDLGRRELAEIRARVSVAIADSEYGAHELAAIGYRDVRVIPLVIDPWQLKRSLPEHGTVSHLDHGSGRRFVLSVGQGLPSERPEFLIDAFHIATTYLKCDAPMVLAGPTRVAAFADALAAKIRELNLGVRMVGSLPPPELAVLYSRASVFVLAGEHDGFCRPVIDAMAFDVPVVARSCAAIPETTGDAALLLPPDAGPTLMAEAMTGVLERQDLRDELARRGRERLSELDGDRSIVDVLSVLLEVA